MDRLTSLDQLMVRASGRWPQEIGALAVLDGAGLAEPGGRLRIEAVRAAIGSGLPRVPRFRQVVWTPRRGLGGPLWVDRVKVHPRTIEKALQKAKRGRPMPPHSTS